jgi:NADPH:quinone reductase-like Zn-dependent oxidoreductase
VAIPADRAVKVPAALDDIRVAAGLLRALTAQYLLKQMRTRIAQDLSSWGKTVKNANITAE